MTTEQGNTWKQVEFGTAIVSTGGGGFGAVNSAIYSNDLVNRVALPSGFGSDVRGMWHNHPVKAPVGSQEFAIARYPSVFPNGSGDWAALADLAGKTNNPNPSLWLMGPDGMTREFKLSERAYFESLTDTQKEAQAGLQGRERNEACQQP